MTDRAYHTRAVRAAAVALAKAMDAAAEAGLDSRVDIVRHQSLRRLWFRTRTSFVKWERSA